MADNKKVQGLSSPQGRQLLRTVLNGNKTTPNQDQFAQELSLQTKMPSQPSKQPSKEAFEIAVKMLAYKTMRESKKD